MSARYGCSCGATFTAAEFDRLPVLGVFGQGVGPGPWRAVEARRCSACERLLARAVVLTTARRPVDPEATAENPLTARRAFAGIDDDVDEEV